MSVKKTLLFAGLAVLLMGVVPASADDEHIDITILEEYVQDSNIKFKGGVRVRGDYTENFSDFNDDGISGAGLDDDSWAYLPYRVRAGLVGKLPKDVYAYIELQTASAMGLDDEQRNVLFSNSDPIDLYMGLIKMNDIGGSGTDLYIGRQELVFDRQFLLSNLDFYNGISHDGFRANWELGGGSLDVFWFKVNETFEADTDTDFMGGHYTWGDVIKDGDIAAYLLYVRDKSQPGISRQDLYTLGGRVGKKLDDGGGMMYNAELAFQFGQVSNIAALAGDEADISALGLEGMFGWGWENGHQVFGRVYLTSGDDDPTDGDAESFNTLFQDFHTRNGIADAVNGTNLTSFSVGWWWKMERHQVGAEFFTFTLTEEGQSAADVSGVVPNVTVGHDINAGAPGFFNGVTVTPGGDDDLGQELDILYNFVYSENLDFNVGLGYFLPGDAVLLATGFDDDAVRLYGQARLRF